MKIFLKLLFSAVFIIVTAYIVHFETERYATTSIVWLKDLSASKEVDISSAVLGQSSDSMEESAVIELFILSSEMYDFLDKKYNLSEYYTSEKLDFFQRLYRNTPIPYYYASKDNLLKRYNDDCIVLYDEISGTLSLEFSHADPIVSKQILESIIARSDEVINGFYQKNAEVALKFITKQAAENKALFVKAIKSLIRYQNEQGTIDPNIDVERKTMILASLETDLVKNEVDYNSKLKSWNPSGTDMKMLKETILNLRKSINKVKKELVGAKKYNELNTNVFDYELLKSEMDFTKEVYQQTLISQEQLKTEMSQNAKRFVVVSTPKLADIYTYPDVIWDVFTWLIILLFIYSILRVVIMLIEDHKD